MAAPAMGHGVGSRRRSVLAIDHDDVGAEIRQQHRAEERRTEAGEFKDANPGERPPARAGRARHSADAAASRASSSRSRRLTLFPRSSRGSWAGKWKADRKSLVKGKSGARRVECGGRRITSKKKHITDPGFLNINLKHV